MKKYSELVNETLPQVKEIFPWDLEEKLQNKEDVLIVDIREPYEYDCMHIENSINVPRGVLESACDWGYQETVPELADARARNVVLVCKSGNRSVLSAYVLQLMGYGKVFSLKTGVRGWNDYEQPVVDSDRRQVDIDDAEEFLTDHVTEEQMGPRR